MQRDTPYMLQVEVPSDVAAIAIITLHPAGRDAQAQTLHQKRLWAKNVASSVRKQKSSKPLIAYSGEPSSGLLQPPRLPTVQQEWIPLRMLIAPTPAGADFAHVQVAVPRVKVVITFKALVGLKRRLGFNTSKEDICLQPSGSDMRITMEHMVMQMLKEQGWHSLEKDMLLSTPFSSPVSAIFLLLCHKIGFTKAFKNCRLQIAHLYRPFYHMRHICIIN